MNINVMIAIVVASQVLTGCAANLKNPPLLFGQTESLGITVNGSATQQNAEITLGYRDFNIAIVPVTVTQQTGAVTQIQSTADEYVGQSFQDALSVLGQFEASAKATSPEVGLGKFFATGSAAKELADGFARKLSPASVQSLPANQTVQPAHPAQPVQPAQPHQ